MKHVMLIAFALVVGQACGQGKNEDASFKNASHLKIKKTYVKYVQDLEHLVWTIEVEGKAGGSEPKAFGKLDGAPVLGYVFPTSLKSTDVGFSATDGIVAMALTSHPDFDDTPLWDENMDSDFANDGVVWHAHWVVLTEDKRVPGGLAVKQFEKDDNTVILPPTNPGMPMYMDSPGFNVVMKGNKVNVVIPTFRMSGKKAFNFDAVTAYMQVNTSMSNYPMLGVYAVYSVASGDLSLPYTVK